MTQEHMPQTPPIRIAIVRVEDPPRDGEQHSKTPLSDSARERVAALRDEFAAVGFAPAVALAAPARRAVETAELLCEGASGVAVEASDAFPFFGDDLLRDEDRALASLVAASARGDLLLALPSAAAEQVLLALDPDVRPGPLPVGVAAIVDFASPAALQSQVAGLGRAIALPRAPSVSDADAAGRSDTPFVELFGRLRNEPVPALSRNAIAIVGLLVVVTSVVTYAWMFAPGATGIARRTRDDLLPLLVLAALPGVVAWSAVRLALDARATVYDLIRATSRLRVAVTAWLGQLAFAAAVVGIVELAWIAGAVFAITVLVGLWRLVAPPVR